MRLRVALACALTALGSLAASGPVSAAPRFNHHLTIAAVPREIMAGEGVVIYGRLLGPGNGGQTIRLYHRLDGSGRGFTFVGTRRTDAAGYYEFLRQEGIVYTNRDWFVRGPDGAHSRTVHERVQALISIATSSTSGDTSHPVVITGQVTPNHAFGRVFLQKQNASGDDWSTVASGVIGPGSNYTISHRFRVPDGYTLRVVLRGDERNVRSVSDSVNVVIQQAQVPGFTIATSAPVVNEGGSTMISGVLDQPGTTTPEPGVVVQLWGRHPGQPFQVLADTTTGQDGSYSFDQMALSTDTVYYAATLRLPHSRRRHSAPLFEGVKDVVNMQSDTSNTMTGQTVTFTGAVLPDKAGEVIYLQRLGKDGEFHTVEIGFVRYNSTFQFKWTIGSPGSDTFRARIASDGENIGASSAPVSVTATAPAPTLLPPAA